MEESAKFEKKIEKIQNEKIIMYVPLVKKYYIHISLTQRALRWDLTTKIVVAPCRY
jgi:ribosomal protein S25